MFENRINMRLRYLAIVAILFGIFVCGLTNPLQKQEEEENYPIAVSENDNNGIVIPVAIPEFVQKGWDAGKKLFESIKENDFVQTIQKASKWFVPLAQSIGYFAKVFMGFMDNDSKELKYIKEQFLLVNLKMDTMEQEFHEIKKMIDWNTIKVSFGEYERSINSLQDMLVSMTEAEHDVAQVMRDHFIMLYERTSYDAASKLYEGIMNTQSLYTENIVVAVRKYTGNHRRKVQKFLLGVLQLIVKGLEVEMMYLTYRNYTNTIEYWQVEWESRLDKISEVFKKADDEIVNGYRSQVDSDLEEFNAKFHGLSNEQYSIQLYNYLTDKFSFRDFFVMVYNPLHGYEEHAIQHCEGHVQFRTRNHNIVVVSTDAQQQQTFDVATANQALGTVPTIITEQLRTTLPLWFVDQMQKRMPIDCRKYRMVAAIKWGAGLWYASKPSRRAYREWTHYYVRHVKMNLLVFG